MSTAKEYEKYEIREMCRRELKGNPNTWGEKA